LPPLILAALSLFGGLLSLDRTAFFQTMVSRPIVAGPVAGYLLGDFEAGCWCAILLEFLWLMRLPIGGAVPPDDALATLAAVSAAASLAPHAGIGVIQASATGVVFGLPFGYLGRWADLKIRNQNGVTYLRVRKALAEGTVVRLFRPHFDCAARFFFAGTALSLVAVLTGWMFGQLTADIFGGFPGFSNRYTLALLIFTAGAGALLAGIGGRHGKAAFGICTLLGFFCSTWLMAAP
jgi:PTS system mannose-specific IIC component